MRLSEAIRLGSLAIQNPQGGDIGTCAIAMGCEAIGKRCRRILATFLGETFNVSEANYETVYQQWPWTLLQAPVETAYIAWYYDEDDYDYQDAIADSFDYAVMRDQTMTLEALCDQVRTWEDELAAKGINVEQVTMTATPETAAEKSEMVAGPFKVSPGGISLKVY